MLAKSLFVTEPFFCKIVNFYKNNTNEQSKNMIFFQNNICKMHVFKDAKLYYWKQTQNLTKRTIKILNLTLGRESYSYFVSLCCFYKISEFYKRMVQ